jgi:hypothetical protein
MDIKEIREANLRLLINSKPFDGRLTDFAEAVETNPDYFSQIMSKKLAAGMGGIVARRIERKLNKPRGWMDTLQSQVINVDFRTEPEEGLFEATMEAVEAYFSDTKIPITARGKAALIKHLVDYFSSKNKLPTQNELRAKIIDLSPLFNQRG